MTGIHDVAVLCMYSPIHKFYAASGGEYNPKRFTLLDSGLLYETLPFTHFFSSLHDFIPSICE